MLRLCSAITPARGESLRFSLHTGKVRPIRLIVKELSDDAAAIGLTKASVLTTAESRLETVFYSKYRPRHGVLPYELVVDVRVVGRAFRVDLLFHKPMLDPASGEQNLAVTWAVGILGQSGDSKNILGALSRCVDKFVEEFGQVNFTISSSRA